MTLPSATRIGQRRRIPAIIAAGVILALAALLPLAVVLYGQLADKDLSPYMPTWWLISDVCDSPPLETAPQFAELTKRFIAGDLSNKQVKRIVDRILDVQDDQNATWLPTLGNFIELAQSKNCLDDDEWSRYLRQIPVLDITTRARLRVGDPLTLHVGETLRCGSAQGPNWLRISSKEITSDAGHPFSAGGSTSSPISLRSGGSSSFSSASPLYEGTYTIRASFTVEIVRGGGFQTPPDIAWVAEFEQVIEVVSRGTSVVSTVNRPELAEPIRQSISVPSLSYSPNGSIVTGMIRVDAPPVNIAFDVFLRSGNREWAIGSISLSAGDTSNFGVYCMIDGPLPLGDVALILRTSEAAAIRHREPTFDSIWSGEIVIESVEVRDRSIGSR